jgi:hypothetical protein
LVIRSNTPATLLLDAAQFNEGANSEYQAPHPHELAVLAPRPGAIFFEDETTALQLVTTENLPAGAILRRTLFDLDNRATTLESVALPASETAIPNLPRGLFKLRAQIVNAEGQPLSAAVETVFARLPRPRNVPKEQAAFGVHCELSPEWLQIAQALGAKWVRLHDAAKITKWRLVEETKGTYRFYDEGVNLAHSMGIGILGMVDGAHHTGRHSTDSDSLPPSSLSARPSASPQRPVPSPVQPYLFSRAKKGARMLLISS